MKKITEYINGLPHAERIAFAQRCRTTIGYLRKAACTGQTLSAELSAALERESNKYITRQYLHPNNYWLIWPEIRQNPNDGLPPTITKKRGKAA